jgi:hypothetical protein
MAGLLRSGTYDATHLRPMSRLITDPGGGTRTPDTGIMMRTVSLENALRIGAQSASAVKVLVSPARVASG